MKILKTDYAALTSNAAATYTANDLPLTDLRGSVKGLNQYTVTGNPTEAFSHDFDGNLTLDRQFVYTWDAENRLIEVQTRIEVGASSTAYETDDKHVHFTYDYMGRRVRKRVETYNGSWPETSDELFVYDGWNVVMVLNANAGNAITRDFTWGLDLSGTIHGAGGIGGLLADYHPTGGNRYWYFYDAEPLTRRATRSVGARGPRVRPVRRVKGHGNVGQVLDATDTNNISIAAHYEYDPYGNLINSSGPYADLNPIRFSTKWFDNETGLGYWGYRYYSPRLGRWISRDPLGEQGGQNICAFVRNSPANALDRLGLVRVGKGPGPVSNRHEMRIVGSITLSEKDVLYDDPVADWFMSLHFRCKKFETGQCDWIIENTYKSYWERRLGSMGGGYGQIDVLSTYPTPDPVSILDPRGAQNQAVKWEWGGKGVETGSAAVGAGIGAVGGVAVVVGATILTVGTGGLATPACAVALAVAPIVGGTIGAYASDDFGAEFMAGGVVWCDCDGIPHESHTTVYARSFGDDEMVLRGPVFTVAHGTK